MNIKVVKGSSSGFTFIELIIVVTIIGLFAAIAVPSMFRARDNSRLSVIYSNLRTIEAAKEEWAIDNKKHTGAAVDDLAQLSSYFHGGSIKDVVNETYVPNALGTAAEADLPGTVKLGAYGAGAAIPAL
jgi:prepilin-type N-terminal cleavage/methylation domain-containing protein